MDANEKKYYTQNHKVGDVVITATNVNPGVNLGGTWILIDKEFTAMSQVNQAVTLNTANTTSANIEFLLRSGHTVCMRIGFVNKVALDDSTHDMFTIPSSLYGSNSTDIFYTRYFIGESDGGNGLLNICLTNLGLVSIRDVVTKAANGTIPAGSTCHLFFEWTLPASRMADSACDKFYWKKTA